jgi:hypothetical protein
MKWTAALATSFCALGFGVALAAYGCSTASNPAENGDTNNNRVIGPSTGPCSPDGYTQACHQITGATQGYYNCYPGTQTCSNGVWGPCVPGSSTRSIIGRPVPATGNVVEAIIVPPPTPDAAGCASDSCDPFCTGFDQTDAGLAVDAAGFSGEQQGSYGGLPGGFQKNNNNCHGATDTLDASPDALVANGGGNACNDCSMADECCNCTANGCGACVPWSSAQLGLGTCAPPPGCNLPDFTIGVACLNSLGNEAIPVCNRGTVAATSGTIRLGVTNSTPGDNHSCLAGGCGATEGVGCCDINLASNPIGVQSCINIDLIAGGTGIDCVTPCGAFHALNRSDTFFINENGTVNGGTCNPTVNECDYCNNWSAKGPDDTQSCSAGSPPPPFNTTVTYTAVCPSGSHPF